MSTEGVGVEHFRAVLGRRLGLHFDDAKLSLLAATLRGRLEATGRDCGAYLGYLDGNLASDEVRILARELTVPETHFFRNAHQFRAVGERALPERIAARKNERELRLLSAGCASGEEPYSLNILLRELPLAPSWDVSITAVDVNSAMLERARAARYSSWALRETPAEIQRRWFDVSGRDFTLAENGRSLVRFEERNLVVDDPELWRPDFYDIVFCRNVLMYFDPEAARLVVDRIARSLRPGGFLFLGHAETLRGVSQDFHLCHSHEAFYYQRKDRLELSGRLDSFTAPPIALQTSPLAAVVEGADSWVDAIREATERVQALAFGSGERHAGRAKELPAPEPPWDLGTAQDLLRSERFTDALEHLRTLPPESAADTEVLLLRAALLTHGGDLAMAEDTCGRLLELDELNAGAHYLLALCREGAGDRGGSMEHDQTAVYLDPSFAMPRLHMGLLARKVGNRDAARQELSQALSLLQREDPSRLLLFGGGFGRDALIALCHAELLSCGGNR